MSRSFVVSPQADRDLDEIADYIGLDSPSAADRFLVAAASTFQRLADMPSMGSPQGARDPKLAGLRAWPVGRFRNYRIFYRETDVGSEIVRVLHAARDAGRLIRG